jgi:hypothetical protein
MSSVTFPTLRRPRLSRGLVTFAVLECLVLAQLVLAYEDQFFTVAQMRQRGFDQGLPFAWHFAMWGDLFVISPLAAYLVDRFHDQWSRPRMLLSLAIGLISSAVLHWTYTFGVFPEAHVIGHALTGAGVVHLFYMGLAIAIFVQFFLFTKTVPARSLAAVSTLVLLHIFVGTHMVLGLINLSYPQDWYAGEPLKSAAGWTIILGVGLTLLWRNLRDADLFSRTPVAAAKAKYPAARKAATFGRFITVQRPETVLGYLKSLDYMVDKLVPATFMFVFGTKLLRTALGAQALWTSGWCPVLKDTILPCVLMLAVGAMLFFSRHSVKLELDLGPKLFSTRRMPTEWGKPKDRMAVLFSVLLYMIFFSVLTWYSDNIKVAAGILLVVAINDWRTRYLIGDGIAAYLADPNYDPPHDDPDYDRIQRRRTVARRFLYGKPHLFKETCKSIGCAVAFALAMTGYMHGTSQYDVPAYFILILTVIINEYFSVKWRWKMFLEMEEADSKTSSPERAPAAASSINK